MQGTTLVHPVGWHDYLNYVRDNRTPSPRWRPPHLNLNVAEALTLYEELTPPQFAAYVRILLAYASAPLIAPERGATGPRRLTRAAALRTIRSRNGAGPGMFGSLVDAGLLVLASEEGELAPPPPPEMDAFTFMEGAPPASRDE